MTECFLLEKCGFFIRYASSGEVDCDQLIETYCKGNAMHDCKRLQYFNKYGVAPSDHMKPDGTMIRKSSSHET
jgi:hypothetical protein